MIIQRYRDIAKVMEFYVGITINSQVAKKNKADMSRGASMLPLLKKLRNITQQPWNDN